MQAIVGLHKTESTYALVEVDRVFAGDDVSDGAAGGLAGGLLAACLCAGSHFLQAIVLASVHGKPALLEVHPEPSQQMEARAVMSKVKRHSKRERLTRGIRTDRYPRCGLVDGEVARCGLRFLKLRSCEIQMRFVAARLVILAKRTDLHRMCGVPQPRSDQMLESSNSSA